MAQKPLSPALMQATVNAVAAANGNQTEAARALGLSHSTVQHRMERATAAGITTAAVAKGDDPQVLRAQVKRLENELKARGRASEQVEVVKAVIGKLARQVEDLDIPPWVMPAAAKPSSPGVPTLFLSDLHWGETVFPSQIGGVNEYNLRIAHRRMDTTVSSAINLLRIVDKGLNYPGIVVPLGGDMISGNIHDELTATNELQTMPAVLDLYSTLVRVISTLAGVFGRVFLPCVSGNHGRDTRKMWAKDRHHTSFDWLLYRFLAKHFDADPRVTFYIPDGPDAYYKVYDHRYLLTHGDQFRGGDGMIGALGPIIRGDHKKRSRNAQIDMEYDTMLIGHWHQEIFLRRLVVNGSMKGYDEYAYSSNFGFEPPCQQMWVTHPTHGKTFRMPVYSDRALAPSKSAWISVPDIKQSS